MRRAVLHLQLVTPAFLGGSSPRAANAPAEWRAASIRGQWRWWFRALAGPPFGNDPRRVAAAEAEVFGSTRRSSLLQIRAEPTDLKIHPAGDRLAGLSRRTASALAGSWGIPSSHHLHDATVQRLTVRHNGQVVETNTVAYLAYGCLDFRGDLTRSCIAADSKAKIVLQWRADRWSALDPELRLIAARALRAWLLLGGIGSKARKGFGSLLLTGIDGELPPELEISASLPTRDDLFAKLSELQGPTPPAEAAASPSDSEPGWTQLSGDTRLFLGLTVPSWQEALDRVGGWLIAFRRRYGIHHDPRTHLQDRDYEWHKGKLKGKGSPDRAGFGLPLPFGDGGPVASAVPGGGQGSLRRASPLMIHVARTAPTGYVPILAHLGGAFLPSDARVELTEQRGRQPAHLHSSPPTPQQLTVVDRFLDDLVEKKLIDPVKNPA